MQILVAGASGFVGRSVVHYFAQRGASVVALVRNRSGATFLQRDGVTLADWNVLEQVLEGTDVVINFSGENVAKRRWSQRRKSELLASRIVPTRRIVHALATSSSRPRLLLNASAVGFYGSRDDTILTEESSKGKGFLASLCDEWEATARQAEPYCRVIIMRLGVVLGEGGGMLARLEPIVSRVGAVIPGPGTQWLSWIALTDVSRAIEWLITQDDIHGAVNFVSPQPVTMATFMRTVARYYRRPVWFRLPQWVLHIVLGEMASTLTDSIRVIPARLGRGGFRFEVPTIEHYFSASQNAMSS